jgi:hypothetical protein
VVVPLVTVDALPLARGVVNWSRIVCLRLTASGLAWLNVNGPLLTNDRRIVISAGRSHIRWTVVAALVPATIAKIKPRTVP